MREQWHSIRHSTSALTPGGWFSTSLISALRILNPYKAPAGSETDEAIHAQFFAGDGGVLPYSTDDSSAERVRTRLKTLYKRPVQVGETRTHPPKFFARFDTGPSTSTEVLAESKALAICRLALVIGMKRDPAAQ